MRRTIPCTGTRLATFFAVDSTLSVPRDGHRSPHQNAFDIQMTDHNSELEHMPGGDIDSSLRVPNANRTRWPFRLTAATLGLSCLALCWFLIVPPNLNNLILAVFLAAFGVQMLFASFTGKWFTILQLIRIKYR